MLTAKEIRQRYLNFFKRKQHEIVTSGPLIPPNDKTLLFTNAGMVQFKQLFLGAEKRSYSRATTCQKCLRVSGKHNDLENVGRTARHHTFFEILGNFSFGDYFKKEAIAWAWEFVTVELGLKPERLWVTIYREDEEAAKIWREVANLPAERIVRMGEKDNFWTMGDTGPCGPCSEIYIDQGAELSCGPNCGIGQCDCDRFLEIWNLVFTQFDQAADGTRSLLAAPNIDTGMGLERIAAVCQGKRSNFDCDLFQELIGYAAELAKVKYAESLPNTNDVDTALRVIADHSRAAAFLIAEGVLPSNESRGYVLRRLLRRALRFAKLLGVKEPFLYKVVGRVGQVMGEQYPELLEQAEFIGRVVHEEEERFSLTLDNGLRLLEAEMARLEEKGEKVISGELCFQLYDTHGFPLDIVNDVAEKRGLRVDTAGFENYMAEQRERARKHQKQGGHFKEEGLMEQLKRLAVKGVASTFAGYGQLELKSKIICLLNASGEACEVLGEGERGYLVTELTPFYGESGGQVGDQGRVLALTGEAKVLDAIKPVPSLIVEAVQLERGELHLGAEVKLVVEDARRLACARNHSCTHLLHAALREVLGSHVHQMGSLVDAEHLRFDFSHLAALSAEELAKVEGFVNQAILADWPVSTTEMSLEEAKASGAMALFDEKYGEKVRVVSMGDQEHLISRELCGGTHLSSTGQAGLFLILSESAVASGTRRIEAVTGLKAYEYSVRQRELLQAAMGKLKATPDNLLARVEALQSEVKKLRKDQENAKADKVDLEALLQGKEQIGEISLVCGSVGAMPVNALRSLMDQLRSHLSKSAVGLLCAIDGEKVSLLLYVSKDLHTKFTAPQLIREVAQIIGGSGGGRNDLAQAGGNKPSALPEALAKLRKLLAA
ncbi:MAG: alanine--tRNA ligase [Desulfovibrio sp.]|nr:alanine--tRNA ligase [Desulfovibrio sp.]